MKNNPRSPRTFDELLPGDVLHVAYDTHRSSWLVLAMWNRTERHVNVAWSVYRHGRWEYIDEEVPLGLEIRDDTSETVITGDGTVHKYLSPSARERRA